MSPAVLLWIETAYLSACESAHLIWFSFECRVAGIQGATVEHNKFCVSVHFRNCEADQYEAVLSAVETTLRGHDELHATRGRKVFEIRPQACPLSLPIKH